MPRYRNSYRNTALGILLPILAGPVMYWVYTTMMIDRAERATRQIQSSANAAFEHVQADQERRERERREQAAQARLEEVVAQREAEAAEIQRRAEEQRKEQAWARFYVAPTACEKPPTWEFQVECGNRYMRAKREFEATWARGEIGGDALAEKGP